MRKRLLFRIAALCLAVLVALVVAELLARMVVPEEQVASAAEPIYRLSENLKLRYEQKPNDRRQRLGVLWETNSEGFRDREVAVPKPEGTFRILALGDSVMLGGDMPLEQIAAKRLETLLNEAGGATRYEVLNMAVAGYDTLQEAEMLKYRGLKYEPDLVIFGYCLNDPDIVRGELELLEQHPDLAGLVPRGGSLAAYLSKHLYLVRLGYLWGRQYRAAAQARKRIEESLLRTADPHADRKDYNEGLLSQLQENAGQMGMTAAEYREHYQEYFASLHINQRTWRRVADALDEMAAVRKGKGVPVVLTILPVCVSFERYFLRPVHRFLRIECESRGIEVVDLLDHFQGEDPLRIALNDKDRVHYSPHGHDLTARALLKELGGKKRLPNPSGRE